MCDQVGLTRKQSKDVACHRHHTCGVSCRPFCRFTRCVMAFPNSTLSTPVHDGPNLSLCRCPVRCLLCPRGPEAVCQGHAGVLPCGVAVPVSPRWGWWVNHGERPGDTRLLWCILGMAINLLAVANSTHVRLCVLFLWKALRPRTRAACDGQQMGAETARDAKSYLRAERDLKEPLQCKMSLWSQRTCTNTLRNVQL